jgi:hypothetical protein
VDEVNYEAALALYEQARTAASALSFAGGMDIAAAGIEEMQERIAVAKRSEAMELLFLGNQLFLDGQYSEALVCFSSALELYQELDDQQGIATASARIRFAERRLEEESLQWVQSDDAQNDPASQGEYDANYEHNLSINFDLRTLIDNQARRPANQIRMGSTDGRNEGWYNGCGWVATYNALILLDEPQHPAEIVRYFEMSGGTVLGGVFGTFPNTIEAYLQHMGYSVNHALFPQLTLNIDDTIKEARVGILAYAHTGAAHFITIEYREDLGRFVVYNDRFARTRSTYLGLDDITNSGSAIDSVAALINNTPEILFSFSLITVI